MESRGDNKKAPDPEVKGRSILTKETE